MLKVNPVVICQDHSYSLKVYFNLFCSESMIKSILYMVAWAFSHLQLLTQIRYHVFCVMCFYLWMAFLFQVIRALVLSHECLLQTASAILGGEQCSDSETTSQDVYI